jgi:hypothetical protein
MNQIFVTEVLYVTLEVGGATFSGMLAFPQASGTVPTPGYSAPLPGTSPRCALIDRLQLHDELMVIL